MRKTTHKQQEKTLKSKPIKIHGIYDFKKKKMIYINLDYKEVEYEYDLEGYGLGNGTNNENMDRYGIVTLTVSLDAENPDYDVK